MRCSTLGERGRGGGGEAAGNIRVRAVRRMSSARAKNASAYRTRCIPAGPPEWELGSRRITRVIFCPAWFPQFPRWGQARKTERGKWRCQKGPRLLRMNMRGGAAAESKTGKNQQGRDGDCYVGGRFLVFSLLLTGNWEEVGVELLLLLAYAGEMPVDGKGKRGEGKGPSEAGRRRSGSFFVGPRSPSDGGGDFGGCTIQSSTNSRQGTCTWSVDGAEGNRSLAWTRVGEGGGRGAWAKEMAEIVGRGWGPSCKTLDPALHACLLCDNLLCL